MYDPQGKLIQEVEERAGQDQTRFYIYLEDELVGLVDSVVEVGTTSLWPLLQIRDLDPRGFGWVLLLVMGGSGVLLLAVRRSPQAATAVTSALLVVFTCAGTPRPPPLISWVHTDPLGTPLAVTNNAAMPGDAEAIWRARYEPFGKATVDEDPDGDLALFSLKVRFPGQYEDLETGWHYNLLRTYDPRTGRYLEPDPIGLQGGRNLFRYASNRPTIETDPSGQQSAWPPTLRNDAFDFTRNLGLSKPRADALAHCIGACQLASLYGRYLADWMLDVYEIYTAGSGRQQTDDMDMDQDNNATGISLSQCDPNCPIDCFTALENEQLRTDGFQRGDHMGRLGTWWRLARRNVLHGVGR